jgi:hypothetical protein
MARLLVIGSPRSGTRSVAALLRGAGLRVGHESMLRDGTVSSLWVVDDFLYPGAHVGDRPSRHAFDVTAHLVRHPLQTIASLAEMNRPHFWHWTQVHTGRSYENDGPLLYAAYFWATWCRRARAHAPVVTWRIEDIEKWWPRAAKILELNADVEIPRIGESQHASIGWSDLGEAQEAVKKEAALYGYMEN